MKLTKYQIDELKNSAVGSGFIAVKCDSENIGYTPFSRHSDGKIYITGGVDITNFIDEIFVVKK